jgi:type IV pilus assembly protein PilM
VAKTIVGLDIGSTSIRAVTIKKTKKKIVILRAAEFPLPRGVVVAGEVRDPDTLRDAIKEMWKKNKLGSKVVNVGLSGPQTMVRQIDLPWEPDEVFRESLPLRIGVDLPVDPTEMTIDYYPLSRRTQGNIDIQRALVVAALNIVAENTADACTSAKLKIRREDYAPFAMIRAAVYAAGDGSDVPGAAAPGEERSCEVVVEVGGQVTVVAIHDHGRPLFIRTVTGGSDSVTKALSDQLQLPWDTAEALKKSLGIGQISGDTRIAELTAHISPARQAVAQQIINLMAGSLVQVVRESVEYFLSVSPDINGVERILLSGGGALLPGYAERLAGELRAPVEMLAPMQKFAKFGAELDPRMTVAVGLALEAE